MSEELLKNVTAFNLPKELFFEEGGIKYEWHGYFGSLFVSKQKTDTAIGTMRCIAGIPCKAYRVWPSQIKFQYFGKDKTLEYSISWIPIHEIDMETIRKIKQKIFDL